MIQTILIASITIDSAVNEIKNTDASMSYHARTLAKVIATRWLSDIINDTITDKNEFNRFLTLNMSLDKKIAYIVVSGKKGNIIAGDINRDWVNYNGTTTEALSRIVKSAPVHHGFKSVNVDIKTGKETIGNIRIVFSMAPVRKKMIMSIITWSSIGAAFIFIGIVGAFFVSKKVTNPLSKIINAMRKVEGGDLEQKVDVTTSDEIGHMAGAFNKMVDGLRERELIKDTFSRYVSKQVAEKILKEKDYLGLKGEKRIVTVLFADIRGFTSLSEKMPPEEVIRLLNEYFSVMIDIIFKYGGMLDKFIGDAIMATYNAPLNQKRHELKAILTGLEMQKANSRMNERRMANNEPQINVGIGINTGEAIAGNVGSEKRLEYTVIGSEVNLAQRIEAQTQKGQLLISEKTYDAVKEYTEVIKLNPVHVKGIAEAVQLYSVINVNVHEDFNENT